MRARGTKRASEGVRKRLEKNLAALLEDPHARMPTVAYTIKRARKDPVQRSLKECAKVIAKKNTEMRALHIRLLNLSET